MPRINVGTWFENLVNWLTDNLSWLFDAIGSAVEGTVNGLADLLLWPPALGLIAALAVAALWLRGWRFALFTLLGLALIDSMRQWEPAMETLALVLVASVISVVLAIPLGIAAARSDSLSRVLRPALDLMQTMPAFVYLIPAVFFFSIGPVPGVVATVVFALPPGVRLTELGIRGVDREVVEAGEAFGSPPRRILTRIQLPLAMPTVMAGVNQVIMLALSMVVIAGMVGAGGLGNVVLDGIQRLEIATGFEGGLAVVILAIFLDRITSSLGDRSAVARAEKASARA
ncbi:proline/glycine betaine ABC transporter permease [Actinomadura alba]|uniref:Proline/glycine betaine ABC transporter permease n=1 Tax=Actinomadura alba TaxID=406431 RepID=A0ABR7LPX2_9ACTN|nr:proline/glycine betaine ABC transporter permease [Actinomadura alba]